jgi:calcineurin-like phosphoesterase
MEPATNNTTLCGIVVEIDDTSGRAISAQQIIYGDTLVNTG